MKKVSRRELLTGSLALTAGTLLTDSISAEGIKKEEESWKYVPLDARKVAQRAYDEYGTSGCLYGSFKGAVLEYADAIESADAAMARSARSFPFIAFRCGRGGFARLKQLCGAVAGAVMFMNCFVSDFKDLTALTDKLGKYAAETELPQFIPQDDKHPNFLKVAAHGLTCKEMGGAWMKAATAEQKKVVGERCKRHTASIIAKAVELLNEYYAKKA
ncbi:MAG: C-GCAxxG-C-C family (seleno)protein [Planctomycetia bacterium]|nr:C-GCAxxG-C-C family (seleno)protein [Planctomycetia bacterium]